MTQHTLTQPTLHYAPFPARDYSPLALCTIACSLAFMEWPTVILIGRLHDGLRGSARFLPQDILATLIICGIPILGILTTLLFAYRSRRSYPALLITAAALLLHAWNLYSWGSMELWFWTPF